MVKWGWVGGKGIRGDWFARNAEYVQGMGREEWQIQKKRDPEYH